VQGQHHPNVRMHQWSAIFRRHDQRLDRGLSRIKILFDLRKLHDVVGGIAQSHELAW
jgi:hypothetical protein